MIGAIVLRAAIHGRGLRQGDVARAKRRGVCARGMHARGMLIRAFEACAFSAILRCPAQHIPANLFAEPVV